MALSRRRFLKAAGIATTLPASSQFTEPGSSVAPTKSNLSITGIVVHTIKVNQRGNWYFVELQTNKGISGLGEASHGFTAATQNGEALLKSEIAAYFELVKGESPFSVELFRQRGLQRAQASSRTGVTAFSSIEQALWDLAGKVLGVPTYELLGGKLRDKIKVYANINRATNERDAQGRRLISSFQRNAELALKSDFKAVKLAPFDDMKPLKSASPQEIEADIDYAISCTEAVRQTIGPNVDLLIDVHSHLNRQLAIQTAKRLEKTNLYWFEEAVDPQTQLDDTKAITDAVQQPVAGGESIAGRTGFAPLINSKALDIIMPDVKHCGGIQECRYIAALAEAAGDIKVSPHNPSGPISTAASVQVCAGMPNFSILEFAYGEVPWRADLVKPAEQFQDGFLPVPTGPGLGYTLNYTLINKHS
ncbi:mandelate racemase/muconate lactonizing enzyme family protein [Spirosoma foliorum]|uniref:Mandelate racemase/muconate lactonizing enzyme family protein n=1 Tax=Spirosoma foliorum TaxID=2710596 RepID=A0A7G5GZJ8_9BACT|nr:mandelate racemase/muconate lactonizing enzyme family protein [Spirosoma foliorum]QMW04290.1 mandelate racemase/muconate lactonizing enzyme family protein [Spirosoma foliorum]